MAWLDLYEYIASTSEYPDYAAIIAASYMDADAFWAWDGYQSGYDGPIYFDCGYPYWVTWHAAARSPGESSMLPDNYSYVSQGPAAILTHQPEYNWKECVSGYIHSDEGHLLVGRRFRVRARFFGPGYSGSESGASLHAGAIGQPEGYYCQEQMAIAANNEWHEFELSPFESYDGSIETRGVGVGLSSNWTCDGPPGYLAVEIQIWEGEDPEPPGEECNYDCECEGGERNTRSLGELTQTLLDRLGFVDPLANPERRTLGALRRDMAIRCGYASSADRLPPGVPELFDQLLNEAEQKLWRRLELDRGAEALPPRMVDDDDTTTLDAPLVFALALGEAKAHLGKQDSRIYLEQTERMLGDYLRRSPANVVRNVTAILQEAQRFLFEKVASFRQSRFFRWPLQQGVRFYDFAGNDDLCGLRLVPELVEGVYVTDSDCPTERWRPLAAGINPMLYDGGVRESWPQRYEFRQCIEIFPAPDERAGFLRIKGKFDIQRFEEPEDRTTIDADLVLMHATAVAKQQFGQQDFQQYQAMVQSRIGDIIAGSHHTRRYMPGELDWGNATPPRPRDGFLPSWPEDDL